MSKLIILDWDDTLFPTSWTVMKDIDFTQNNAINKYKQYFKELDNVLYDFLIKCLSCGKVFIVTNAMIKWVYRSAEILPKTNVLLDRIIVISARDIYQQKYPDQTEKWKLLIFKYIADKYTVNNKIDHIISIGDANYEFIALLDLINHHNIRKKGYLKSIRLVQSPSYNTIVDQLTVLNKSINKICVCNKHMDLKFGNM